jgi:hypothetical protein
MSLTVSSFSLLRFSMVTSCSVFFKANSSLAPIPIAKLPVGSMCKN